MTVKMTMLKHGWRQLRRPRRRLLGSCLHAQSTCQSTWALSVHGNGNVSNGGNGKRRTMATLAEEQAPSLITFGLGGHKWTRVAQTAQSYELYIREALEQGVTLIEAGQEGGEQVLVSALQECLNNRPDLFLQNHPITVTSRLGYRSWSTGASPNAPPAMSSQEDLISGDVVVEETSLTAPPQARQGNTSPPPTGSKQSTEAMSDSIVRNTVVHNLSPDYIEHYLSTSPLASFCDTAGAPRITWMPMIHNPEAQLMQYIQNAEASIAGELPSLEERMEYLRPILRDAMETMQSSDAINQFGLVSNGLGLPPTHPLHMPHALLLPPCTDGMSKFTTVQLPANMLEPNGLMVARKIKGELQDAISALDGDRSTTTTPTTPNDLDIWAMRPLTAYPVFLGTGMEQPYKLFDYPVTSLDMSQSAQDAAERRPTPKSKDAHGNEKHWTHQWDGPPPIYQVALQTCMSHFDAEPILEAQLERDLTTEERETIDGCKLIQSMLHDLDSAMDKYNSLDVFEDDLYQRIIPLLADTFEALDETSSDVLQAFFSSYALAVRYTIARKTRRILKEGLTEKDLEGAGPRPAGDTDGDDAAPSAPVTLMQPTPMYPSLDGDYPLQELALRHVLEEPAISRIVVGTTSQAELKDTLSLVRHISQSS